MSDHDGDSGSHESEVNQPLAGQPGATAVNVVPSRVPLVRPPAIRPSGTAPRPQPPPQLSGQPRPRPTAGAPGASPAAQHTAQPVGPVPSTPTVGTSSDVAILCNLVQQLLQQKSTPERALRVTELPDFKGTRNSADTEQFIIQLNDIFILNHIGDANKGYWAAKALEKDTSSPAYSWFKDQRQAGVFRNPSDPSIEIDYSIFCALLRKQFFVPLARRFQLEDTFDRFTQRGTVDDHFVKFNKVVNQLREVEVSYPPHQIASKFFRSLKPELREIVFLRHGKEEIFELNEVYGHAVQAEYQSKQSSNFGGPRFNGIFPPKPPTPSTGPSQPPQSSPSPSKRPYCRCHREKCGHWTDDCPVVQALKAAGKWRSDQGQKPQQKSHPKPPPKPQT